MDIIMRPIGIIHSPFQDKGQTPTLLDIKPYVPEFDQRNAVSVGWFETRRNKE